MKSRPILFLIILLIPFEILGQVKPSKEFSYSVSKPYPVIDAPHKYYFHKGGEALAVKIRGGQITLQKFISTNLNFEKVKVYDNFPDGFEVEGVIEFNERFYFFYSLWDKPNEVEQLFCRELDFHNGSFYKDDRLLIEVDGKITGTPIGVINFWSFGVRDKFTMQFSHDGSKMLVQYRKRPEIKNDAKSHDVIGISVFDDRVNLLWDKEIKMPYTEKKMNIIDYSIDSEGNTYILSTVYEDNTTDIKKEKDGDPNYRIELFRIKANTSDIHITPIALEDKFINRLWLYESPDDYMICAGFYNNGRSLNAANGVMLFKVGKDGDLYDKVNYDIPIDILNQYVSRKVEKKNSKKAEKDKAEFEDLELRKLVIGEDGSLLLIGEQNYMTTHTTYTNGNYRTYYTFHYNDMLVTKIDKNGRLWWMKKLPKRQTGGSGQGGMSYEYIYDENRDSHYILFLDNINNLSLPLTEVPAVHRDGAGGFLTAYKIDDASGDVNKVSILDTRDVGGMPVFQFFPRKIFPVAPGEFAFEVYKKNKEDVMIKVVLNK